MRVNIKRRDARVTGGGKKGARKKDGVEVNDKNVVRERLRRDCERTSAAARIGAASFRSRVVFKHRRLLRETASSQSGQSGAIIQEEFMTNVRALSNLTTSLWRTPSILFNDSTCVKCAFLLNDPYFLLACVR